MRKNFIVSTHKRYIKRKSYSALGSLVKILTEIITNSDDSYRRIKEGAAPDHSCEISVNIDKKTRKVVVIDRAEGMSPEDIENNFREYGADKSGRDKGHKTRGLFGQGATDVLFTQKKGEIISFKNGTITRAAFRWEGDTREVSLENLKSDEDLLRKKYNIPKNGTIVSFVLASSIKISQNNKRIVEELRQFYMLRFIMADSTRKVVLDIRNNGKKELQERLYYEFPSLRDEDVLWSDLINFSFEDKKIEGELKLVYIKDKQEKEKDYGDLKILVFDDEKNVYANTFFKPGDRYPGTERMYGYLKLYGTAEIIRDKLNLEEPEEILMDTRDGFNESHSFYKNLNIAISSIIEKYANKLNEESSSKVNSGDFENQKKLFTELNKHLREELEEISDLSGDVFEKKPPHDGFDFARERIKTTLDKKYSLRIIVNNKIIKENYKIFLRNNNTQLLLNPESIEIKKNSQGDEISYYNIYLQGKEITEKDCVIEAYSPEIGVSKKLFVAVVAENIHHPKAPIEFHPNYLIGKPKNKTMLSLYVDNNIIKKGSEIKFLSTNKNIFLSEKKIEVKNKDLINEDVALVKIYSICDKEDEKGKVIASSHGYVAEAEIKFSEKTKDDSRRRSGFLKGWNFTNNPDAMWQKYLHPKTGEVNINEAHPINKEYFGNKPTTKNIKSRKISQNYLAEILSDELAQYTTKEMIAGGKISNDAGAIFQEHQNQKNKWAKIIYKYKFD